MKLISARVTNFRCVEDSGEFGLDQVTCLVGKNESGKTSLLKALHGVNPWNSAERTFDKERDYPRRYLLDYEKRHEGADAEIVVVKWKLDVEDKTALKEVFGNTANHIDEFTTTTSYGNGGNSWLVSVDEAKVVDHLLNTASLHAEELTELQGIQSIKELKAAVAAPQSERHTALLNRLNLHFKRDEADLAVIDLLNPRLPKFLYFSQYQKMDGQVSLEAIAQKKANNTLTDDDKVFIALCDLVGVPVEKIATLNQFEQIIARFEAASSRITREIFEFWSQNKHLKVQLRIDAGKPGDLAPFNSGNIVRTRIFNEHHEVTVSFDDRSTGFVWFFSFLVLFSQVKTTHSKNLIILLDEPALSLHAKAQSDLLRYIEERLAPHHQVIYTTHSPFMVPAHNLTSVRTVEDVVVEKPGGSVEVRGTKVGDKVLSTDRDTLFPLQSALGYEITQTLFLGKHTLLVEGPSDLLYLRVFSDELKKRGRTPLDPRWVICPMGGAGKVSAFMSLFGANDLNVAVLLDYAHGEKKQVENVRKSHLLKSGHVFTAEHYANQPEADTEDLLGSSLYIDLVNKSYDLKSALRLPSPEAGSISRIVPFVADHFRTMPPDVAEFDHYAPSLYLFENRASFFKAVPAEHVSFDRFEKLIKDLNSLLPHAK
jgi:predicted ATP-dependent endonuclease of OLD family